jgi:hypothetical protein
MDFDKGGGLIAGLKKKLEENTCNDSEKSQKPECHFGAGRLSILSSSRPGFAHIAPRRGCGYSEVRKEV